jgi:hypothetical protein
MKKRNFYQMSILVTVSVVLMGCVSTKPKVEKQKNVTTSSQKIEKKVQEPKKPQGLTLSELKANTNVTNLDLKGHHVYNQNAPIMFSVDTKDKDGYLYIIYLDNKGETALLYPNERAPLTEFSGKYLFPRDFGNMNIRATKDCKDCKEEKTTIYALLTKKPIIDIQNITKAKLMNIVGDSASNSKVKHKGLKMDLGGNNTNKNSNINVGKFEFVVK